MATLPGIAPGFSVFEKVRETRANAYKKRAKSMFTLFVVWHVKTLF